MSINILDEMKNDFLVYAKETNTSRSIPTAADGLKPSLRAALWTMYNAGFTSNKPHVKSAKITGKIIGEVWPHGDSSAYESIVRMSQPWVNNLCEIDWHGANGSLQGGPQAASSRYTECRLSKAAEEGLLEGLKKNVVDFIPNFSEDAEWPSVLPALMPRLFVNGSQGIGYTIAQEWEPGNLNEFVDQVKNYIDNKKVDCSNIYPDYPTGGIIINKNDIHNIYETGKGNVVLRAKTEIVDNSIIITELPYQVYVEPIITKIKELVNSNQITGIEDIYNKSGDEGIVIEIECNEDANLVLNKLFKLTDLQTTFSANQVALVDGFPILLTLEQYIKVYLEHNLECIRREYKFDLTKAEERKEIVEGLVRAISIIDDVISTIKKAKSSDAAKQDLIKSFSFTENQAKAIIDMRLGKLANLEIVELNNELKELLVTIDKCNKLLASSKLQNKEFLKRLDDFTSKYSWQRRTQVCQIDVKEEKETIKKAAPTKSEEFMIVLEDNNIIKRISLVNYRSNKVNSLYTIKEEAKKKFILISNMGKLYKLQTNKVAQCSMQATGTKLDTLLDLQQNEKIIAIYNQEQSKQFIFFITEKGLAKKMVVNDIFSIGKNAGAVVMKLDGDAIIASYLVDEDLLEFKVGNKIVKVDTAKFKTKGRSAGGVRAIKLKNGDKIYEKN